jgi:hypothetical protein
MTPIRSADVGGRHHSAFLGYAGQQAVPTLVDLTDEMIARHAHVVERHLVGTGTIMAQQVKLAANHAMRIVRHENE